MTQHPAVIPSIDQPILQAAIGLFKTGWSKFKMESGVLIEWKFHLTSCLRAPNFH